MIRDAGSSLLDREQAENATMAARTGMGRRGRKTRGMVDLGVAGSDGRGAATVPVEIPWVDAVVAARVDGGTREPWLTGRDPTTTPSQGI
jgi:hypothetical protein